MRSIKTAVVKIGTLLVSLLAGMVLVLSTGPVSASGEKDDKAKVEINKIEKDKDKREMIEENKLKDKLGELRIERLGIHGLLLDEDILGEEILEDLLGEED